MSTETITSDVVEIAEPPVRTRRSGLPSDHAVWPIWRAVVRRFAMWRMLFDFATTPGGWTTAGLDMVSGLRRNPSTKQTFELLAGEPEAVVRAVCDLAALNVRRQTQMFRLIVVAYVTAPVSAVLAFSQFDPEAARTLVTANADLIVRLLFVLGAPVLLCVASLWRARQIASVLDLVMIERDLTPGPHEAP